MATRSKYNAGTLAFADNITHERVNLMSPIQYRDDFVGAGSSVIPAAGSAENGVDWVKKIVLTGGTPTVAGVANAIGGQVACALTATSEKQDAVLYWGDSKALDVTKGLVYETRFQLSTLPTTLVQAVIGLASNWIDGPDSNTCYLQVGATASGALLVRSFDGTTTVSAAAGVTLLNTDWAIVRIDATDLTDVKMFINGNQVTTNGQINFAATGTLAVLQPYAAVYKASGTGVGTLTVDYVKVWMNRS